jgi:beta-mannanase
MLLLIDAPTDEDNGSVKISASLLCLATFMTTSAMGADSQYSGIGFYMGDPTPSSAVPRYDSYVATVRQQPQVTAVFIDYRDPIWSAQAGDPQWSKNAQWAANNLALLTSASHLNRRDADGAPAITPIVSVGLTDNITAFQQGLPTSDPNRGKYSETAAIQMMNDIADGKYDAGTYRVWPAIFDAYRENGFKKIYLRIGWEQNGTWYGWRARTTASKDAYIAAWRHVADLAHSYAASTGMAIETVWSPSASYANFGLSEEASYPGDAYVDIIAPTAYSSIWNATRSIDKTAFYDWSTKQNVTLAQWYGNPVNRKHSWDYPASDYWNSKRGWGVPAAIAFALAHQKRFGLSETGTGGAGAVVQGGGPVDEGDYPLYLAERFSPAVAQGLKVEFVDVWAQPTGTDNLTFLSGGRPLEARAWQEFGVLMADMEAKRNVAVGKKATAKSSYSSALAAAYVSDAKTTTRWASKDGSSGQWTSVDLGQRYTISRIKLEWDAAYASGYKVQVSNDASTWSDLFVTTTGNGATDDLVALNGVGRYVRVLCMTRGGGWNYSLREIEIYP